MITRIFLNRLGYCLSLVHSELNKALVTVLEEQKTWKSSVFSLCNLNKNWSGR